MEELRKKTEHQLANGRANIPRFALKKSLNRLLEAHIAEIEKEQSMFNQRFAAPDFYHLSATEQQRIFAEATQCEAALRNALADWERLAV